MFPGTSKDKWLKCMPRSEETQVEILIYKCDLDQDTPSSPPSWLKTWPGMNPVQVVQGFDLSGENLYGQPLPLITDPHRGFFTPSIQSEPASSIFDHSLSFWCHAACFRNIK